jgi:hypothetical protein
MCGGNNMGGGNWCNLQMVPAECVTDTSTTDAECGDYRVAHAVLCYGGNPEITNQKHCKGDAFKQGYSMFTGTMCSVYGTAFGAILIILGAVALSIGLLSTQPIFFILFVAGIFGVALGGLIFLISAITAIVLLVKAKKWAKGNKEAALAAKREKCCNKGRKGAGLSLMEREYSGLATPLPQVHFQVQQPQLQPAPVHYIRSYSPAPSPSPSPSPRPLRYEHPQMLPTPSAPFYPVNQRQEAPSLDADVDAHEAYEQAGQGDTSTRDASTALTTERKEGGASDRMGGAVFVDILPIKHNRTRSRHRQSPPRSMN